jgi:hypothetical protein
MRLELREAEGNDELDFKGISGFLLSSKPDASGSSVF